MNISNNIERLDNKLALYLQCCLTVMEKGDTNYHLDNKLNKLDGNN